MRTIALIVCILFQSYVAFSQDNNCKKRGERLSRKAEKYLTQSKPNFKKAEKKLRRCLYKYPTCHKCYSLYSDIYYDKKSLEEALNFVNSGLVYWPDDNGLLCKKFNLLNNKLSIYLEENNFEQALPIINEIELNFTDKIPCRLDKRWDDDQTRTFGTKWPDWEKYYAEKKLEILKANAIAVITSGDREKAREVLSLLIAADLSVLGSIGDDAKNWAFGEFYKISYSQYDYQTAIMIAQTLIGRGYLINYYKNEICLCYQKLYEDALQEKDYDLAIGYLEQYKNTACSNFLESYYNSEILKIADVLANNTDETILKRGLDLLCMIDCKFVVVNYSCGRVKTIRRTIYLNLSSIYEERYNDIDALHYLNSILVDFPDDKEVLKRKARLCYKFGKNYKKNGEYDLAVQFFSNVGNDPDFGIESLFLIGKIYENAFLIDSAEKYMQKAMSPSFDFSSRYENSKYSSLARLNRARYFTIKGALDSAKLYLTDYCAPEYSDHSRNAAVDSAFYNLRNDFEFQHWVTGKRRIKYSNFRLSTDYNEDEWFFFILDYFLDVNEGPEYYLYINTPNYYIDPSYPNSNYIQNSDWKYDVCWADKFSFIIDYQSTGVVNTTLSIEVLEKDGENYQKPLFEKTIHILENCRVYNKPESFIFNYKNEIPFKVSFNYSDNYDEFEPYFVSEILSTYKKSPLQIVLEENGLCLAGLFMKPVPFLLFSIAIDILKNKNFSLDNKGINEAIVGYLSDRYLPKSSFISQIDCVVKILNTLSKSGWADNINY